MRDRGLGPIRPRGVITTAMVLHSWQRRVIEEVFACPVTNRYGCEEVSLIACECEAHDGLHVNGSAQLNERLRGNSNGQLNERLRDRCKNSKDRLKEDVLR